MKFHGHGVNIHKSLRLIASKRKALLMAAMAVAVLAGFVACGGSAGKDTDSASAEPMPDSFYQSHPSPKGNYQIKKGPRHNDRIRINSVGRLAEVFNDSNKFQYAHAERLGIRPITSLYDTYYTTRPLRHITSCGLYQVDSLTHSLPFLVPQASRLLEDIGCNFIDSLGSRGADGYRVLVTSLLRTSSSVRKLRRVNVNATDSSTHKFGTTFDLSYTRFHCLDTTRTISQEDLKNLLAEVLYDMRRQGRCLVKYERKTGCFHVTVVK